MTEASSGYRSSHSSAASREAPHLTPTEVPEPRNAKILVPTLTTTSPSHGSSCQAPGLARQYASRSSHVIAVLPVVASPGKTPAGGLFDAICHVRHPRREPWPSRDATARSVKIVLSRMPLHI